MSKPLLLRRDAVLTQNSDNLINSGDIYNTTSALSTSLTTIDTKMSAIDQELNTLQNLLNDEQNVLNKFSQNVSGYVYYSGSGETVFTSNIIFNQVSYDSASCYNTTTGKIIIPIRGIYLFNFTYYSNKGDEPTTVRPGIIYYNSSGTEISQDMVNGTYGRSVVAIKLCEKGTMVGAGAYGTSWKVSLFGTSGHNNFSWCLLKPL